MNDKWIDNLRNLADGYEPSPPDGLLDDVKDELLRRGLPSRAHRLLVLAVLLRPKHMAAAAVAACVAVGSYLYFSPDTTDTLAKQASEHVAGRTPATVHGPVAASVPSFRTARAVSSSPSSAVRVAVALRHFAAAGSASAVLPVVSPAAPAVPTVAAATDSLSEPVLPSVPAEKTTDEAPRQTPQQPDLYQAGTDLAMTRHPHSRRASSSSWQVEAYLGGLSPSLPSLSTTDNEPYQAADVSTRYTTDMLPHVDNALMVAHVPPTVTEDHRRPVRLGLSVKRRLSHRWSLLTGLTYSRLRSTFYESGTDYYTTTEQRLYYVGIPLGASYSLWQNRYVDVYATAGGEVEKLVRGKAAVVQSVQMRPSQVVSDKVSEHRPVFSTYLSAGIAVQPTPHFSLFAEPGVRCHFDNGSGVHSSYTDQPVSFSLSVGLRIQVK